MKKVLFRITNNLNVGGVQKRLLETLPELLPYFNIHIIVYKEKGTLAEEFEKRGIKVHFVPSKTTWDISCILKIKNLLKKYHADIVHTHSYGGCIKGSIAAKWAGVKKVISHIHVPLEMHWYGKWKAKRYKKMIIEKLVHKFFVSKVVFVSKTLMDEYINKGGFIDNRNKLRVLYNGFDLSCFPLFPKEYNGDVFIIGSMGRIVESKNFFFFLHVASELVKQDVNFLFYIIGDGPLLNRLKSYVKEKKIEKYFVFTGMIKNPIQMLSDVHLYLFCSKTEGLGGALIEPLLTGTPVLAVENRVNREIMDLGRGGEVLPEDIELFVKKIFDIKNNYNNYKASLSFEQYRSLFSMERLISDYRELYEIG